MVTSTNAFHGLFRGAGKYAGRGYNRVTLYGTGVVKLNKPLSDADNKLYHVTQVGNNEWLAFVEGQWDIEEFVRNYKIGLLPKTSRQVNSQYIPTWEQNANRWLNEHHVPHTTIARCYNSTPQEAMGVLYNEDTFTGPSHIDNWTVITVSNVDDMTPFNRGHIPFCYHEDDAVICVKNNRTMTERERKSIVASVISDAENNLNAALWFNDEPAAKHWYNTVTEKLMYETRGQVTYADWSEVLVTGQSVFAHLRALVCCRPEDKPMSIVQALETLVY